MDDILSWFEKSSANTLTELQVDQNNLTTIPGQLPSFIKLERLYIGYQSTKMTTIYSGAWTFASPVYTIAARSTGIEEIRDGAFNGLLDKACTSII